MVGLYTFLVISASNFVAKAKMDSTLKAGYFVVIAILTIFLFLTVFT